MCIRKFISLSIYTPRFLTETTGSTVVEPRQSLNVCLRQPRCILTSSTQTVSNDANLKCSQRIWVAPMMRWLHECHLLPSQWSQVLLCGNVCGHGRFALTEQHVDWPCGRYLWLPVSRYSSRPMTSSMTFGVTGVELSPMHHVTQWCDDVEECVSDDAHFSK